MRAARVVLALVTAVSAVVTSALLHWPGWSYAPVVLVVAVTVSYACVSMLGARSPHRPGPSDAVMLALAAALATTTGLTAVLGGGTARDGVDNSVSATASDTVRALYTFTPADVAADAARRRAAALAPRLTGRLLADYRSQGSNVALPSAVETRAAMTTTVQAAGVGDSSRDTVRVLIFATETITVPSASPPTTVVPIVRWAVMRRVGSDWRLADIYPAGIGG